MSNSNQKSSHIINKLGSIIFEASTFASITVSINIFTSIAVVEGTESEIKSAIKAILFGICAVCFFIFLLSRRILTLKPEVIDSNLDLTETKKKMKETGLNLKFGLWIACVFILFGLLIILFVSN